MPLSIFVEPVANNGYRASSGAPLHLIAEAATREEALHAGMFKDNPMFEEVVRIMAENRQKMDAYADKLATLIDLPPGCTLPRHSELLARPERHAHG